MKQLITTLTVCLLVGFFAMSSLQAQSEYSLQNNATNSVKNSQVTHIDQNGNILNDVSITHSESTDILPGNSVACAAEGPPQTTGIQSFYRVFDLDEFSEITQDFKINTFTFGVEGVSADFPVFLKIHTLSGSFTLENMTEIASESYTISQDDDETVLSVNFSEPPIAAEGSTIVAELLYTDGAEFDGALFVGSNSSGQSGPTFIRSEACGLPTPTDTADIGFENLHWVLSLEGELFEAPDLGPFSLLSPSDDTEVTLDPEDNTLITISWEASANASLYNWKAIEAGEGELTDENALTLLSDFSGSAAILRLPNSSFYNEMINRGHENGSQVEMIWSVEASGFGQTLFADETFTITFNMGTETSVGTESPFSFELEQNYPNPFNPTTNINFSIPFASDVTLEVYNMQGQKVASLVNNTMNAGSHTVAFNAENLSSGIYMYRLTAGSFTETNKMMLLK